MSYTSRFAACLPLSALPLFAQAGLGSISGELVDATGARLPRAALRVVEKSTGIATSTASNEEGLFAFPALVVGNYTLTIKATGFKDKQLDNLNLSAFQQLSVGRVTLEVGQGPAETVTVTATQELVKDSAVRSDAILSRQVKNIPV